MARVREKAQGFTKRTVGQMIGDDKLVQEGIEQEEHAERSEKTEPDEDQHKRQQASK
jgi:uncharacterized protein YjbJ (UPF0337 family)